MKKMKNMTFQILDDHTEEIQNATEEAVERALEAVGIDVANFAEMKCPVDTGLLRNSITYAVGGKKAGKEAYSSNSTHAVTEATKKAGTAGKPVAVKTGEYKGTAPNEKAVFVGSNVEYAPYVEMGRDGGKVKGQPFLKPAFQEHKDRIKQLFLDAINDVL
jgi:hypothetical protein